jgi:hypothetical protein
MGRFGSLEDIEPLMQHVRFTSISRHPERRNRCPLYAKSRHWMAIRRV